MYADQMTPAMRGAIEETDRRRIKQRAYNEAHGITPTTIMKAVRRGLEDELKARKRAREGLATNEPEFEIDELIKEMEAEMLAAANDMAFERAAMIRDQVLKLRRKREEISKHGGSTMVRRSDVENSGHRGKKRPEAKAGMPGARAGKRRKGR
jgi:excinuclease ABC subunit B